MLCKPDLLRLCLIKTIEAFSIQNPYKCFAMPVSILKCKITLAAAYTAGVTAMTLSRVVKFLATATASIIMYKEFIYAEDRVLYECYGDGNGIDQMLVKATSRRPT